MWYALESITISTRWEWTRNKTARLPATAMKNSMLSRESKTTGFVWQDESVWNRARAWTLILTDARVSPLPQATFPCEMTPNLILGPRYRAQLVWISTYSQILGGALSQPLSTSWYAGYSIENPHRKSTIASSSLHRIYHCETSSHVEVIWRSVIGTIMLEQWPYCSKQARGAIWMRKHGWSWRKRLVMDLHT